MRVDQRKKPPVEGLFRSVGKYRFTAGKAATVTISNKGTVGHVIVDAVRFVPVAEQTPQTAPARILEMSSYHAIVACVAAGTGVAIIPTEVLDQAVVGHAVERHPLPAHLRLNRTHLVWSGEASAPLQALMALLPPAVGAAQSVEPAPQAARSGPPTSHAGSNQRSASPS